MKTVCENDKCTGCMACIDKCPKNAIIIKDTMVAYNAVINENKCISCGLCEKDLNHKYGIKAGVVEKKDGAKVLQEVLQWRWQLRLSKKEEKLPLVCFTKVNLSLN